MFIVDVSFTWIHISFYVHVDKRVRQYAKTCLAPRRLQGMVVSMSRIPTFRRRFRNLVKVLYLEALQTGLIVNQDASTTLKLAQDKKHHPGRWRLKANDIEVDWTIHDNNSNV